MNDTPRALRALVVLTALVAAGCQPATIQAPPTPELTASTSIPATAPPSLEPTSAVTAEPSPTFEPEIVATKPEDIAGVWFLKWRSTGSLARFDAHLTFTSDATFSMDDFTNGMHIFDGRLLFQDGKVSLDSDECYDEIKAAFFHCTMTFTIYATIQDGKPIRIRFVAPADAKGIFFTNVKNKTLQLAQP